LGSFQVIGDDVDELRRADLVLDKVFLRTWWRL
jgi:hypothetical protein